MSVLAPEADILASCRKTAARLAEEYQWFVPSLDELSHAVASRVAADTAQQPKQKTADAKTVERYCCIVHFAALFDAVTAPECDERQQALRELFEPVWHTEEGATAVTYRGYLFRVAMRMVKSKGFTSMPRLDPAALEEMAVDAASTALINVQANIGACRDRETFWGWVTRIVENSVVDHLRRIRPEELVADEDVGTGGEEEERVADAVSVRGEFVRKCRLGRLSGEQRATVYRFFWLDQTVPEIAEALSTMRGAEVTAAAVSVWKSRALKTLGQNLRERGFR